MSQLEDFMKALRGRMENWSMSDLPEELREDYVKFKENMHILEKEYPILMEFLKKNLLGMIGKIEELSQEILKIKRQSSLMKLQIEILCEKKLDE